jgi:hypothetical protein
MIAIERLKRLPITAVVYLDEATCFLVSASVCDPSLTTLELPSMSSDQCKRAAVLDSVVYRPNLVQDQMFK